MVISNLEIPRLLSLMRFRLCKDYLLIWTKRSSSSSDRRRQRSLHRKRLKLTKTRSKIQKNWARADNNQLMSRLSRSSIVHSESFYFIYFITITRRLRYCKWFTCGFAKSNYFQVVVLKVLMQFIHKETIQRNAVLGSCGFPESWMLKVIGKQILF